MKDKMRVISGKKVDLDNFAMLNQVFGKNVISNNGEIFGKVKDIVIEKGKLIGIIIKHKSIEVFVDVSYVNDIFTQSVMLRINPVLRVIGMLVYDAVGKKLGKVIEIVQKSNTLNEIDYFIVKKNIFKKPLQIKYSLVTSDVKNIILKKEL